MSEIVNDSIEPGSHRGFRGRACCRDDVSRASGARRQFDWQLRWRERRLEFVGDAIEQVLRNRSIHGRGALGGEMPLALSCAVRLPTAIAMMK
jgi:hypothetical protein